MSELGGGTGAAEPALTTAPSEPDIDEALVVQGAIKLRLTHPNLYRTVMLFAVLSIALGLNFWILAPTFWIYDQPNALWGTIFLVLGIAKIVFLNFYRRLRAVRATMAFAVAYFLFLSVGTSQPFVEGQGSLQLPIVYLFCAVIQIPLLLEPFINPWTAKR
jgi:hypothetical protein